MLNRFGAAVAAGAVLLGVVALPATAEAATSAAVKAPTCRDFFSGVIEVERGMVSMDLIIREHFGEAEDRYAVYTTLAPLTKAKVTGNISLSVAGKQVTTKHFSIHSIKTVRSASIYLTRPADVHTTVSAAFTRSGVVYRRTPAKLGERGDSTSC
jgi:hypothetical protein